MSNGTVELTSTRQILADLVAFPTVSATSNLDLIAYAASRLEDCGARIELWHSEDGRQANLFATIGPDKSGGIVLSGHTDVVPADEPEWASNPFSLREADGLLYARGAADMKGFVAAALAMAPIYARLDLATPVHFAFTFDEETGCLGAQELVRELAEREHRPGIVIVGEPTGMRLIEGHKGCYEYCTRFTGLEGHGSEPDRGVNAVEYAARYVTRLLALGEELRHRAPPSSPFEPPWTTVQVGHMSGGVARNVIAGHCEVDWEMRPVAPQDADYVKNALQHYCDADLLPAMQAVSKDAGIETEIIAEVCALEPMDENAARDLVSKLTGANTSDVVAFGTEAGLYQQLGMAAIVCGPGFIEQAHKPDEYVSLEQLGMCLDMLQSLAQRVVR